MISPHYLTAGPHYLTKGPPYLVVFLEVQGQTAVGAGREGAAGDVAGELVLHVVAVQVFPQVRRRLGTGHNNWCYCQSRANQLGGKVSLGLPNSVAKPVLGYLPPVSYTHLTLPTKVNV